MSELTFHDGVAYWNGSPLFFVTAEYPYFRDDSANWKPRLRSLQDLGVQVVSTYIPWRHHQVP
jgi:beta-galactosidase